MKVDLMFNEVVTVCKRRVVEDVDLDKIAQHLNDDGRYLDEFLLEHQYGHTTTPRGTLTP